SKIESYVSDRKIRLTRVIWEISVKITVCFNSTWIGFRAYKAFFPNTICIFKCTGIALSEIEHVVITINYQKIFYINSSSKELNPVIGTIWNKEILNFCSISNAV